MSTLEYTTLGRTGLTVSRTGFGALPIQRTDTHEAVRILRAAFDAGITFFDTARAYSDSETKMGRALADVRDSIVIATKSAAATRSAVLDDLQASLRELRTDYVDLMQLHNPKNMPDPEDPESAYAGLVEVRRKGMARFVGISNHVRDRAIPAIDSGLYDTLQFPLCHISSPDDLALVERCRAAQVGFIAMKPLCGGLLTDLRPPFAFLRQYANVVPIYGIQRMTELEKLIAISADPPALDDEMRAIIERDKLDLAGEFCRACGYCLPCPQHIPIPMASRMGLVLRRLPYEPFLTDSWREKMRRIEECTDCGECRSRCPYGLDPPALLKKALADYEAFYRDHAAQPKTE
jgi:predicted aldo/keto reductase-like oxidoreductase